MAERKIGDMAMGVIALILFVSVFSVVIVSFDSQFTNSEGYGDSLINISNTVISNYTTTELSLTDNTYNTTAQTITGGIDTDTRGSSQAIIISKNTPSTIKQFTNSLFEHVAASPVISLVLTLIIVAVGLVLVLRAWRPGGF